MQLNLATDNAIRAVLLLAEHGGCLTGKEIAGHLEISPNYMGTTLKRLRTAGLVYTQSGCMGGYRLNKPPDEISLYDILIAMEHTIKISHCLETEPSRPAVDRKAYPIYSCYLRIQAMMETKLKEISILDVLERNVPGVPPKQLGSHGF